MRGCQAYSKLDANNLKDLLILDMSIYIYIMRERKLDRMRELDVEIV